MYLAIMLLCVRIVTDSHQQDLVTVIEPTETFLVGVLESDVMTESAWFGEFESDVITETVWFGEMDSSSIFGVTTTEDLTSEYSTADTTEESTSIFTTTEGTGTSDYSTTDTIEELTLIFTPTEGTDTRVYSTGDTKDNSVSDSTSPLVDTISSHTITIQPTMIVKTTPATNISNTTTALNATISSPDADGTKSAIIGGVVGGAAGVAAVVAVVVLAWRCHQRLKVVSKDELGAGLNVGAPSSRRRPNEYIMSPPSNARHDGTTSTDMTESNELNILIITSADAGQNNDVGYKDTSFGSSYEKDLYANTGEDLYSNTGNDVYTNTIGLSNGDKYNLSECSDGPSKTESDNDVFISGCDDLYINTRESYDNKNVGIETIRLKTKHTRLDDIYETSRVHSNREPPVKINNEDFEKENEELYVKPNGSLYVESEGLYVDYDGADRKDPESVRSRDALRKHGDVNTTQDQAVLSITDSLYINASPQSPLRHDAMSQDTVSGLGFSSPHSGYYKSPKEVADAMDGHQAKAGQAVEDHEYVNIKSVETLIGNHTSLPEELTQVSSEYSNSLVHDVELCGVYNNVD